MRAVFKNETLQKAFEEKGFVTVPFLNTAQVKELSAFYETMNDGCETVFHASSQSPFPGYRKTVHEKITAVFEPLASELLINFKPLYAAYTVKEPGKGGHFDFHLDWSMVDEDEFVSLTFWCPLVDTSFLNGNLWLLESSHKLGRTLRCGPTLFQQADISAEELGNKKFKKVALPVRAGSAIIYDHRIFHGSPDNLTAKKRLAINYTTIPAEAPSFHYHVNDKNEIEVYEVGTEFYCTYHMGDSMQGYKLVKTIHSFPLPIDRPEINAMV
ncbi:MAG TPA: phytanoyl-CoA dioxygenase family protein, partial [Chitinophagales bacterium]|nr:phytanoyl-CoA dioxygenase family protein [Chitinophagales bacterium]